jgi:hypothetical protein
MPVKPNGPTASIHRVLSGLDLGGIYSYSDLARRLYEANPALVGSNIGRTIKIAVKSGALVRICTGSYRFLGPLAQAFDSFDSAAEPGNVRPMRVSPSYRPDPIAEVLASLAALHNRLDDLQRAVERIGARAS